MDIVTVKVVLSIPYRILTASDTLGLEGKHVDLSIPYRILTWDWQT